MAKRIREFKRISFTAKTGELIRKTLVDKTFHDHFEKGKCKLTERIPEAFACVHVTSGSLDVARLVESNLKVGTKRATLDIPDPYCTGDSVATIKLLRRLAQRLLAFAETMKKQTSKAVYRIAEEVQDFADRNPLVVLAEIAQGDD